LGQQEQQQQEQQPQQQFQQQQQWSENALGSTLLAETETEPPLETAPIAPPSQPPPTSSSPSPTAPGTQVQNQIRPTTISSSSSSSSSSSNSKKKKNKVKTQSKQTVAATESNCNETATMTRTTKKSSRTKQKAAASTGAAEGSGAAVTEQGVVAGGVTGSLVLTPQQINGLPVYNQLEDGGRSAAGTYSGQFAYFYPHDGSAPSMFLLGEDSYLNVTEQQHQQQHNHQFV